MNALKKEEQDFDLMYIELSEVQKNLELSTKNTYKQNKKMTQIFTEIRDILNITHGNQRKKMDL